MSTATKLKPLSGEEKMQLMEIYSARLRFFMPSFIGFLILAYSVCYAKTAQPLIGDDGQELKLKEYDYLLTATEMRWVGITIISLPCFLVGMSLYRKRILAFKRDAKNGHKEEVAYRIIRKQFFSNTGQYFVSFDDPDYMHHEVDEVFYHDCQEGDYAYIYRAPASGFVFDNGKTFTIL